MKRLYISSSIIAAIVALSISAILLISMQNHALFSELNEIITKYESNEDCTAHLESLQRTFKSYSRIIGSISSDERLQEIDEVIACLLPMYVENSEEFLAQCYLVKTMAEEILAEQLPSVERLL